MGEQESADQQRYISAKARNLSGRGQTSKAIALLEEALTQNPDNPYFLSQAAHLHRRAGNNGTAIGYFERIHSNDPRNMFAINALGDLYAGQGRDAEAERILLEGRRIAPGDMFCINTLGNLYANQGRIADAERVLLEGRRIDPKDMATVTTLGYMYLTSQRYGEFNALAVAARFEGQGDVSYLSMIARGAMLQHRPGLARLVAGAALHCSMTDSTAALYIAAVPSKDSLLPKLRAHFGEYRYQRIEERARRIKADPALKDEIDPRLAPRTSAAVTFGGDYSHPVNRGAVNAFRCT